MNARMNFFQTILSDTTGYLKIAGGHRDKNVWHLRLLKYPGQLKEIEAQINAWAKEGLNTYFSPHLFSQAIARKEYALPSNVLCADLDTCHPSNLGRYGEPLPDIVLETSAGRYQAIWLLDKQLAPDELEALNKRLSFGYADLGCDKSGWDIGQLLRVPGTPNFKHKPPQEVRIVKRKISR